jgi:hypothetical protein
MEISRSDVSDVCASPTTVAAGGTMRVFHRFFSSRLIIDFKTGSFVPSSLPKIPVFFAKVEPTRMVQFCTAAGNISGYSSVVKDRV